jgi:broad specificity phosphatase PhoE
MEFIRHLGELRCTGCGSLESNRNIYYARHGETQVYWFVCGVPECGQWTRLAFGYEEIGPLSPQLRRQIEKIRRFEEQDEVSRYGTNW